VEVAEVAGLLASKGRVGGGADGAGWRGDAAHGGGDEMRFDSEVSDRGKEGKMDLAFEKGPTLWV